VLELHLDGHVDVRRELTLEPGTARSFELDLPRVAASPPPVAATAEPQPVAGRPRVAATAARGRGKLTLDTDPWTTVYWGKNRLGPTPLLEQPMPAGVYQLRLVNPDLKIDYTVEVEVRAGATTVKRLSL
jgi:serine/threonine-protein kinase